MRCAFIKQPGQNIRRWAVWMRCIALALMVFLMTYCGGCGQQKHSDKVRAEAAERWQNARTEILVRLAEADYRNGRMEKCRERIADAFAQKTDYPPLYILAARVAMEDGELRHAAAYLDTVLARKAESAEAHWLKGSLEELIGNHPGAAKHYAEAVRISPLEPEYLLSLSAMLTQQGKRSEAIKLLAAASRKLPTDARIHLALADLYALEQRHSQAAKAYTKVLRLKPNCDAAREGLALALDAESRRDAAGDSFAALGTSALFPSLPKLALEAQAAQCLFAMGRTGEAAQFYWLTAKACQASPAVRFALANIYFRARQDKAAAKVLKSLIADCPNLAEAHAILGYLSLTAGRPAEATGHLRCALDTAKPYDRPLLEKLLTKAQEQAANRKQGKP